MGELRARTYRLRETRLGMTVALVGLIALSAGAGLALAAAGELDPRFGDTGLGPGKAWAEFSGYDKAYAVAVQPDGYIVAVGSAQAIGQDLSRAFAVARFVTDGTLDFSFVPGGKVTTQIGDRDEARAVAIQQDGKIVVAGSSYTANFRDYDFALARYNPDGSLDPEFGGGGVVLTDFGGRDEAYAIAIQADGKIVVAGSAESGNGKYYALARYEPDGMLDLSFGYGGQLIFYDFTSDGTVAGATALALQQDGKIVAVGSTRRDPDYVGRSNFGLARFTPSGAPDPGFGTDGKVTTSFGGQRGDGASAVAIQADGKIVAAGFTSIAGSDNSFALARYNPDGSLDPSFSADGKVTTDFGGDHEAYAVAIQADGRIVAAGVSYSPTSAARFGVARFSPSGSLDPSFSGDGKLTTNFGGTEEARAIAIQPDGNIVVAGFAEGGSGSRLFALARYLRQ